jgi:SAP domain-containing protein
LKRQFIVEGAARETGTDCNRVIEAADAAEAERLANLGGLLVSAVRPVESQALQLPQSLEERNWRTSPAHLLLLSRFRNGDSPLMYRDADYWKVALQESAAHAIARFMKEGILEPAELPIVMDYKFKVTDLKTMLKERGLKVSGIKADLVWRLVEADMKGMLEVTKDIEVYRCSAEGMQLADAYLQTEKMRREEAEREVFNLLVAQDFSGAARVMIAFEVTQVFARGLGIDWKNYTGKSDEESLRIIFEATPAILKGIENDRLNKIRVVAGMMKLWGWRTDEGWLSHDFKTGTHLDGDAACRMLIFYASHSSSLQQYKKLGFKSVRISAVSDAMSCDACQQIDGKVYSLEDVPELPYAECTCEMGCRCEMLVDYMQPLAPV